MAQAVKSYVYKTLADVFDRVGEVAAERIIMQPAPGRATERDLLRMARKTDRIYELVDGILVEKVMGFCEGGVAADLIRLLGRFLDDHGLGDLVGPDATMRLMPGLVRIPDVSFISWDKLPGGKRPTEAIPDLVPDLAIEVLSEGNTRGEMRVKLKDYFLAGVVTVWFVDPRTHTVTVYTAPDTHTTFGAADTLDGADVLPGLQLPVQRIFVNVPSPDTKPGKGTRNRKPKA